MPAETRWPSSDTSLSLPRTPQVVAENLRLFVGNLVERNSLGDVARTLLADRGLVELWWQLITAVRWQARFFRGLETLKASLEGNAPLRAPTWWEDERRTAYRTSAPPPATSGRADEDVDGNDDDAPEPENGHDGEDDDEDNNGAETEPASG